MSYRKTWMNFLAKPVHQLYLNLKKEKKKKKKKKKPEKGLTYDPMK